MWFNDYADDLQAQGYRASTVATYEKILWRLEPLLRRVGSGADLLRELTETAPATRATYLAAVRAFDRWLYDTKRIDARVFGDRARVRLDRPSPKPLPRADEKKIDAHTVGKHRTASDRLALLYLLMRDSGLRIGEAVTLRWSAVALDSGREGLRIVAPKGRADRFVPLTRGRLLDRLRRLRRVRPKDAETVLATRRDARPWTYDGAYKAWRRMCEGLKLGLIPHPHQCRHTAGTEWIRKGVSQEVVRRLLGHANFGMLQAYVDLTNEDLRRELRRLED